MKKNLILASILISTIVSTAAPAMAGIVGHLVCNAKIIVKGDRRCRDRRPSPPPAPQPGYDSTGVRDISDRGEWITLRLDYPMYLSSVKVQGFDSRYQDEAKDVNIYSARVYSDGWFYDVDSRGPVLYLRQDVRVSSIQVYVKARMDRTDAEFTVYSVSGQPYVRASRR